MKGYCNLTKFCQNWTKEIFFIIMQDFGDYRFAAFKKTMILEKKITSKNILLALIELSELQVLASLGLNSGVQSKSGLEIVAEFSGTEEEDEVIKGRTIPAAEFRSYKRDFESNTVVKEHLSKLLELYDAEPETAKDYAKSLQEKFSPIVLNTKRLDISQISEIDHGANDILLNTFPQYYNKGWRCYQAVGNGSCLINR